MSDIYNPSAGGGGGSGTLTSISPADASLIFTPNPITTTGTIGVNLGGAFTWTASGAASAPAVTYTGTPFAGTGTTSEPLMLFQPTGTTASTSWNANGTFIGVNADSGFAGNFFDFHVNGGASLASLSTNAFTLASTVNAGLGGLVTLSRSGTTSNGAMSVVGALVTGGTGSNSFPQIKIEPTGATAVTTWSTGGTGLGMNMASGFTGNFIDLHSNGAASAFFVQSNGAVISASSIVASEQMQAGNGDLNAWFGWGARSKMLSATDGIITFTNNAGTGFTSLNLGPTVAAPTTVSILTGNVLAGTTNTAGASLTIAGSQGTGTGAGGAIIFQTAPAGSTGSTQNPLVTALTIAANGVATFTSQVGATTFVSNNYNNANQSVTILQGTNSSTNATFMVGASNPFLKFGGTTSSFSSIAGNGTSLNFRLADNSADASITAANIGASGSINSSAPQTTLNGTTAGTAIWSQPMQGTSAKLFIANFSGYENNTATNQTITYTTAFAGTPVVVGNNTGLTVSTNTTTFTITAPNNTTLFSGEVIVMGV